MIYDQLYQHQKIAVDRYKEAAEIPLFMSVGTGKSATALAIADYKYRQGQIDCVLVIAPNGVHTQWAREEIVKWLAKDINLTVSYRKNKPLIYRPDCLNFVCTNIETFSTKERYLDYVKWVNDHKTMIILDEATRIKNPKAIRTQRLLTEFNEVVRRGRQVLKSTPKTVARAILTGTPVTNGPFDLWPMFEFLRPGWFGLNWYAFCNRFGLYHSIDVNGRTIRILINEESWQKIHGCSTFEGANLMYGVTLETYDIIKQQTAYQGPYRRVDELKNAISKVAYFVEIEDVIDMPPQTYQRKMLDMSSEQARVYRDMRDMFVAEYKDELVEAKTKLTSYIRLQQIASGFVSSQVDPDENMSAEELAKYYEDPPPNTITWFDDTPKIDQLLTDLEELVSNGKGQVIVVCHFSAEAERLFDEVTKAGYKACLQTGWKKVGSIDAFKRGDFNIMIANIRVISMGFNLQELCHHMIFYSNTFSLEDRIQVEGRIYRTGQKYPCIYIDYVMKDTIDERVYAILKQKKDLADYIRGTSVKQMLTDVE